MTLANPKNVSQFGLPLQLECMKLELLVIADQRRVNTFPGLVHTTRHTMEVGYTLKIVNLRETFDYDDRQLG